MEIDCARICEFSGYSVFAAFYKIRPEDALVDKTPGDVKTSTKADLRAVIRNGVLRPLEAVQAIQPDDELLFFGDPEEIGRIISRLKPYLKRKAIIIGGGDVGSQIAANLSGYEDKIEVIESNAERCNELSQHYPDITVLKGDGTDIALLQELKITPDDYIVSVAHSDEINLMVSLIGRDLGARYTFTRTNRPGYASVYNHLGISGIASSHTVLLNFVDNQLVTECIAKDLKLGLSHDLVEVRIPSVSRGGEVKLGDIGLPALSVILGLTRNFKYMVPAKSTVLEKGDSIIIAVPPTAIRELEKAIHKAVK
jgi:trk system potassium uptake protein TrkA